MILLHTAVNKAADPQQEALQRIRRFLDTWEPTVKRVVVGGRDENNASYKDIRTALLSGEIPQQLFLQWQQKYAMYVVDALQPVWDAAFESAAKEVENSREGFLFDSFAPAVKKWTENRAADFVTSCSLETKKGIKAALKRTVYHEEIGVDELAKVIRPMIGLTRPQVVANQNYYNRLLGSNVKPRKAAEQAIRYAERQHRYRAQMIARTETAMAYNQAEYEVIRQAQRAGYMGHTVKIWCTAADERTCSTCHSLDGKRCEVKSDFTLQVKIKDDLLASSTIGRVPPAHPHCRCTLLYEETDFDETEPPTNDKLKDVLIQDDSPLSGLSKDAVISVSEEIGKALTRYPSLTGYITNLETCEQGYMATAPNNDLSGVTLKFSKYLFANKKTLAEAVQKDVSLGGSPENVTWETAGVHELGHVALAKIISKRYTTVDEMELDWEKDITAKLIVKRAMKSIHTQFFWVAAQTISQYASTSYSEAVGESVLDCYVNGKNAQKLSIAIERELRKCL